MYVGVGAISFAFLISLTPRSQESRALILLLSAVGAATFLGAGVLLALRNRNAR